MDDEAGKIKRKRTVNDVDDAANGGDEDGFVSFFFDFKSRLKKTESCSIFYFQTQIGSAFVGIRSRRLGRDARREHGFSDAGPNV